VGQSGASSERYLSKEIPDEKRYNSRIAAKWRGNRRGKDLERPGKAMLARDYRGQDPASRTKWADSSVSGGLASFPDVGKKNNRPSSDWSKRDPGKSAG